MEVTGLPDGEPIIAYTLELFERVYPFAWLGIIADVATSTNELICSRYARALLCTACAHALRAMIGPAETPT